MINVACAVIKVDNKILIARKAKGPEKGLWEFPGGKCQPNESINDCVIRETQEELGLIVEPIEVLFYNSITSENNGAFLLNFILCFCREFNPILNEHLEIKLIKIVDLHSHTFVVGDKPFINWLTNNHNI